MSMEEIFATFIAESRDQLEEMERSLFALEKAPEDAELLNTVFRAAHTIKGSAGLFALEEIVAFTHTAENLLDALRHGQIRMEAELVNELLAFIDLLRGMIDGAERGEKTSGREADVAALVATMHARLEGADKTAPADAASGPESAPPPGEARRWHLHLRFAPEIARSGNNALALLQYLEELCGFEAVQPFGLEAVDGADFDAASVVLGFDIALRTERPREEILAVFEWVEDETQLQLIGPDPAAEAFRSLLEAEPDDDRRTALLQRLLDCGSLGAEGVEQLRRAPEAVASAAKPQPAAVESTPAPESKLSKAAARKTAAVQPRSDGETRFIRVDARRLDKLINLVGELVIAGSGARMLAARTGDEALIEANSNFLQLVEDVRDSSLALRTVPLDTIFSRFTRVVREISRDLGKRIDIRFEGGETELDRGLIEHVSDPLMHLVRNAADHGIETPEARSASGKPAVGEICLRAFYDSGSVVVEVSDDGRGVDTDKVRRKAIDAGLVSEDQVLSNEQIHDLMFAPGLSTAGKITNVSGRGVGLDVVRKNLAHIRGSVELQSRPGKGCTFRLRLPLTLAIIDGFLVSVAGDKYVIPVEMIRECIEAPVLTEGETYNFCRLRGSVLPYVRLRRLFEWPAASEVRENLVVVQVGDRVAGLVVDELLGESQTVVKPLGRLFAGAEGVGGATILGSGEVGLILDIPALLRRIDAESREQIEQQRSAA